MDDNGSPYAAGWIDPGQHPEQPADPAASPPGRPAGWWTRRRRGTALGAAGTLIAGGLIGAGIAHAAWPGRTTVQPAASGPTLPNGQALPNGQFPQFGGGFGPEGGNAFPGGPGAGGWPGTGSRQGTGQSSNAADGPTDAAAIAKNVDPGVVDITTRLTDGVAAGTGMVLTANGEVLTNNHVIDGARSISVRDVGNGKTYSATVAGYDRAADIAVLHLQGASGLATIKVATTAPSKGAAVVGIGNAGGTGGTPSYAGGAIIATGRTIRASDSGDGTSERLTGLLQTDAAIEPGDSGGPLVNAAGQVVGMDTAASNGLQFRGTGGGSEGFAIPIRQVLQVADAIQAGQASATVHVGPTAELGVYVSTSTASSGVLVAGVLGGGPAAKAGLTRGDAITSVAGVAVSSADALSDEMTRLRPGQAVTVTYTSSDGQQHTTQVRLGSGPAQ